MQFHSLDNTERIQLRCRKSAGLHACTENSVYLDFASCISIAAKTLTINCKNPGGHTDFLEGILNTSRVDHTETVLIWMEWDVSTLNWGHPMCTDVLTVSCTWNLPIWKTTFLWKASMIYLRGIPFFSQNICYLCRIVTYNENLNGHTVPVFGLP